MEQESDFSGAEPETPVRGTEDGVTVEVRSGDGGANDHYNCAAPYPLIGGCPAGLSLFGAKGKRRSGSWRQ